MKYLLIIDHSFNSAAIYKSTDSGYNWHLVRTANSNRYWWRNIQNEDLPKSTDFTVKEFKTKREVLDELFLHML